MSTFHSVFPLAGILGIIPVWYDLRSRITGALSRLCYNFYSVQASEGRRSTGLMLARLGPTYFPLPLLSPVSYSKDGAFFFFWGA